MRWYSQTDHRCRWCGSRYRSKKAQSWDGFCSNVCKQAHYRAYKKYAITKLTHKNFMVHKNE